MTSVTSTFNEFWEKAGDSFDESFKRVSNSFDESFKQVQATYDEVWRNTGNPYFLAPDRKVTSSKNDNMKRQQHQKEETSSYRNFFNTSMEGTTSSIPSWGDERNAPVARFRDFDSDHRRSGKLTMACIAAASKQPSSSTKSAKTCTRAMLTTHVDSTTVGKPFDELSESTTSNSIVMEARQKILQHLERQQQDHPREEKDSLSDEDSNKSSSNRAYSFSNDTSNKRSIENLLGYHSQRSVTRTKSSISQPVGLEFMTLNTQVGTMLIVSKIEPSSLFASSGLGVGDAVLSINGVAFRSGGPSGGNDNFCRPDAEIAQKLLEKGWNGRQRDHRGRNSPDRGVKSESENRLQVTIEYQKFDGRHSPSPVQTPLRNEGEFVTLASTFDEAYVTDEDDGGLCATECSSAAVEAVAAVTTDPASPSKKERQRRSLLWGPARAFLKRNRTPTKSRKSRPESPVANGPSTSGRTSPPKVIHSKKNTSAKPSPAVKEASSSSRLAELRSKHSQLRHSSNQKLAASKKRLLSAHIETTNQKTWQEKAADSCESPASLGTQLEQDKKTIFDEKVESMRRELLSSVKKQAGKITAMSESLTVDASTSDDEYHLARSHQENLILSVQNLSIISRASDIDDSPDPLDREHVKKTPPRSPSRQSRTISLLDDASWSTLEHLELELEAERKTTTAQVLGEHHQELIRLNKKVSDKLRSKVDLLKRSNMKLAEEVAELRKEDDSKAAMLSSWQKQMEDKLQEMDSLSKELELYKSQLRVCSLQSDKRQQELMAQLERQEKKSSDRADMLLQRIGVLERSNCKLMAKLQNADKSHSQRNELEEEVKQSRQKLASQTQTIESLLDSNDELTTKNLELEKQLNECRKEKEEYSSEALVAEIAICTARNSFLERQLGHFRDQVKTLREETQHEKEKRMFCQRQLEDALVKLNDPVSPYHVRNTATVPQLRNSTSEDVKNVSAQSDGSNLLMDKIDVQTRNWNGNDSSAPSEEKKTMEISEW